MTAGFQNNKAKVIIDDDEVSKLLKKYKISLENVKEAYPDIVWGGRS